MKKPDETVDSATVSCAEFRARSIARGEVIEFAKRLGWPPAGYSGVGGRCELTNEVEWRRGGMATAGARRELFSQLLTIEHQRQTTN